MLFYKSATAGIAAALILIKTLEMDRFQTVKEKGWICIDIVSWLHNQQYVTRLVKYATYLTIDEPYKL